MIEAFYDLGVLQPASATGDAPRLPEVGDAPIHVREPWNHHCGRTLSSRRESTHMVIARGIARLVPRRQQGRATKRCRTPDTRHTPHKRHLASLAQPNNPVHRAPAEAGQLQIH
jgi:hypothetical protein